MLNTFSYLVFILITPFALQLHIRKQAAEPPNCQTQSLGYWHQPATVFETIWEEKNQYLITFVPHHWLLTRSRAIHKSLDSSWSGGHSSWGKSLRYSPLCLLRIKATFQFLPNSHSVYFIQLQWAEKSKILASNNLDEHTPPTIYIVTHRDP